MEDEETQREGCNVGSCLELMPQFIADVPAIMARSQTSLVSLPENISTKNAFIIIPSLPVRDTASRS
eukprot:scaffold1711_cov60-Attheya_sp.AAC.3